MRGSKARRTSASAAAAPASRNTAPMMASQTSPRIAVFSRPPLCASPSPMRRKGPTPHSRATSAQVSLRTSAASRCESGPFALDAKGFHQHMRDAEPEHAVAQKLQPLIGARSRGRGAGVSQRLRQQAPVGEDMPEALLEQGEVVFRLPCHPGHRSFNARP